jgi:hypothetical protein
LRLLQAEGNAGDRKAQIVSLYVCAIPESKASGKCSKPGLQGDLRVVTSLATPPGIGAESVFKDFPGDLRQAKEGWI